MAEQLRLFISIGKTCLHPLEELAANCVALGGAHGAVLGDLVDERADRRGEPTNARTHCLDLGGVTLSLLLGDLHQLTEDLVHRLAPLLEDVDQRMLRTRWIIVAILKAQHLAGTLAPVGRAIIAPHVGRNRRRSSAAR